MTRSDRSHPLLAVEDLVVRHRGRLGQRAGATAVGGVSFAIEAGEIVGLAGESGSGKSTLARTLVQLLPPAAGQITLAGRD